MDSVAVIAEFNPFHNGHAWLVSRIRERFPDSALIAIMSGNTVQRGGFAVFDKYERARAAVENGFDVVLELPFPYSCSVGEQFARAGVSIANGIGASVLAFGSETGDLSMLTECAARLSSAEFASYLEQYSKNNRDGSVIKAINDVYLDVYGEELPTGSNDILALEYLKAILLGMYPIEPYLVHRTENFRATDARRALSAADKAELDRLLPDGSTGEINRGLSAVSGLLLGLLRAGYGKDSGNGIVNAMRACAMKAGSFDGFAAMLPTKTYTMARYRREMIAYIFGVTDEMKNESPEYTVLLAASKRGQSYLASVKKKTGIPILTRYADSRELSERGKEMLELAIRADSVFCLGYNYPVTPMPFKTPYMEK